LVILVSPPSSSPCHIRDWRVAGEADFRKWWPCRKTGLICETGLLWYSSMTSIADY